jgi:hypothetical protein
MRLLHLKNLDELQNNDSSIMNPKFRVGLPPPELDAQDRLAKAGDLIHELEHAGETAATGGFVSMKP